MGMFDEVKCDYSLPWPEAAGFGFEWQSKDTDDQCMSRYEIRADGTIWHEQESGLWVQLAITGEIEFHHMVGVPPTHDWYSVTFWFRDGVVKDCVPLLNRKQVKQ
jgi:hypothetical protein